MPCLRCGANAIVDGANYCAGCLLLAADADEDAVAISADEAPPCELLSIMGETPRAVTTLGEQTWPVRRLVAFKVFKTAAPAGLRRGSTATPPPRHPNIAPLLETGVIGGRPYVVTPYLAGGSLTHCHDRHRLGVRSRVTALLAVTDALTLAHSRGAAHGRLTPPNVLCQGQAPFDVQIVDFDAGVPPTLDFEERMRSDVDAVITLAETLLPPALLPGVDLRRTFARMRLSARTATDLTGGLADLQRLMGFE